MGRPAQSSFPASTAAWPVSIYPTIHGREMAYTVNATGGDSYLQKHGASYREVLDLSDWDRSVMTNVPGESGNPGDPHYGDLIKGWADGHYHPLPYSKKAVEAAAESRLVLTPE